MSKTLLLTIIGVFTAFQTCFAATILSIQSGEWNNLPPEGGNGPEYGQM